MGRGSGVTEISHRSNRGRLWGVCLWLVGISLVGVVDCGRSPGAVLYFGSGCARCHGADFSGTQLGPPLKGLKAYWTPESLSQYLDQPASFRQTDRLKALHQKYRISMPRFDMTAEQRQILVAYLLEKSGD